MKNLISLFALCCCVVQTQAQWNNTVTGTNDYFKIQFASTNTGYVLRNQGTATEILSTTNAAGNWAPCTAIPNHVIHDFHFINDNTGFVVTDSNGVSSHKIHVFKTVNGGSSWTKISVIDSVQAYYSSVHFSDALHGTITENYGTIWYTGNGGVTWSKQVLGYEIFMDIEFPSPAVGYIGCWDGTFAYVGTILKTIDSGATWNIAHIFPDNNTAVDKLSFVDNTNGYASMVDYSIYKTNDGGASWDSLLFFKDNGIDIMDMFFTSMSTGFAVDGFGNIYKTTNGAQTWTVDFLAPMGSYSLNAIVISGVSGYASGYEGQVLKRDDVNGVNEWSHEIKMNVYPNPSANGIFQLQFGETTMASLTIFNSAGATVATQSHFRGGKIDLSGMQQGLYHIQVITSEGRISHQQVIIAN